MLSKILVATEASETSRGLIECLDGLRRVGSQRAVLAHVVNVREAGGLYLYLRRLTEPVLERQKSSLEKAGFQVETEIPLGVPFVELNRIAAEQSCSVIVVGSLGESLVKEAVLGSTAASVLQNAVVPVLLIRMEIVESDDGRRCRAVCSDMFSHILFPTDFSETAARAFQYLEHVVAETKSAVTLLHVQDQARIDPHLKPRLEEFNEIDRDRLERLRRTLLEKGAPSVEIEIPSGSPTGMILERARRGLYSLIVMGSQGRGYLSEIFLGSVAHNIARRAPLPVLFVPALH